MGVVSPHLLPDLALLDADLTLGLPPAVTAATGIDAMVHAIESYTSKLKKNPLSDLLAREALQPAGGQPGTRGRRRRRPRGAPGHAAGRLPGRAGLRQCAGGGGACPGLSAGRAFPHSPRPEQCAGATGGDPFQRSRCRWTLCRAGAAAAGRPLASGRSRRAYRAADRRTGPAQSAQRPAERLRDAGVDEAMLPRLAADAMLQQRLLVNNPREVGEADALAIYRAAY